MTISLIVFAQNEKELKTFCNNNKHIMNILEVYIIKTQDYCCESTFPENFIFQEGKSLGAKVSSALRRMQSDIVTYMDALSVYFDETLSSVKEIFENHKEINWIIGKKYICDENGKELYEALKIYPQSLIIKGGFGVHADNCILQEASFFRHKILSNRDMEELNKYNYAIDFCLWKIIAKKEKLYTVNSIYVKSIKREIDINILDKRKKEMKIIQGDDELSQREKFLLDSIDGLNCSENQNIINSFYVLDPYGNKYNKKREQKLTIITICYNDKDVYVTCESIVNQTMQNFEWIVIDGGSCKEILSIIQQYSSRIDYFISEKDNGVYNAMNKGIKRAKGQFINFMNSGDIFNSCDVLEKVFSREKFNGEVLYGKEKRILPGRKVFIQDFPNKIDKNFFFNFFLAHQSMFVKASLFDKYGLYDESFKISSDNEKNLLFISHNVKFEKLDYIIAARVLDGISDDEENKEKREKEKRIRREKYFSDNEILELMDEVKEDSFLPLFRVKSYAKEKIKKYYILNCMILKTIRYS